MRSRLILCLIILFTGCHGFEKPLLVIDPFWQSFHNDSPLAKEVRQKYKIVTTSEKDVLEKSLSESQYNYCITTPFAELDDVGSRINIELNSTPNRKNDQRVPVFYNRNNALDDLAEYINTTKIEKNRFIYLIISIETAREREEYDYFLSRIDRGISSDFKTLKLNRLENDMRVTLFLDNLEESSIEFFVFMASELNTFCIENTRKFNKPYIIACINEFPAYDELLLGAILDNPDSMLDFLLNTDFSGGPEKDSYEIESQFILLKNNESDLSGE